MAGASLLTLLDDIAAVLDDVSLMTKVAAKKTAGVLGDDLALNAQQVTGVNADRELPVVWAVAKGSLRNKAILVPAALLIRRLAPPTSKETQTWPEPASSPSSTISPRCSTTS
ncbi:DUF808 family protein, partial [Klebsiella pneumoniae subsp. pneumoniae]